MTTFGKIAVICGAMLLAGCNSNNPLLGGGEDDAPAINTPPAIQPGSAQDPSSIAYFQQTIGDRVLFEVDQATITPTGQATLNGQASWLRRNLNFVAVIEGHADEQGTREYNLALGARRADAARNYLISQGIDGARLKVVSYGKERPLEICSDESCYSKNRRAVTVLAAGLTG